MTAGIVNFFAHNISDSINPKNFRHLTLDSVKPMSMEHLQAGFIVWLVSLLFPIFTFFGEWIIVSRIKFLAASIKKAERKEKQRKRKLQEKLVKIEKDKQKILQDKTEPEEEKTETEQKNKVCLEDVEEKLKPQQILNENCKLVQKTNEFVLEAEIEVTIESLYNEIIKTDV